MCRNTWNPEMLGKLLQKLPKRPLLQPLHPPRKKVRRPRRQLHQALAKGKMRSSK